MSNHRWSELCEGPWIATGNVAKVKVLHELHRLISSGSARSVLDIGCVGPSPLQFWEPLLCTYASDFHLTGVDPGGLDEARILVEQRGWADHVSLRLGNGYKLREMFPDQCFDVVIATQVLEHVARLSLFMEQVAAVLRSGGEALFTIDSAHWRSRFDFHNPRRLMKNVIKKSLSVLGFEKHYDLPWFDHEVVAACTHVGLKVVECRYYNMAPLKFVHNHIVSANRKNAFIRQWFELEEFLNEDEGVRTRAKHLFMGLYLQARKP